MLTLFVSAVSGCAGGARRDQPLATLDAARKVRYVIAPDVAGDPNGLGPPGTTQQLRQWVAYYMAQMGLDLAGEGLGPHDVALQLSLSARGGSLLLYGTAGMVAVVDGRSLDQWSTSERVEPASGFARTLARDLVEALVHSSRLAAHADAAGGAGASPILAPVNGAVIPVVAVFPPLPSPDPAAPAGSPSPATAPTAMTAPATATQTPGAPTSAARAHARQGLAFYDLNRFQEAYLEYEQAYLIEQDPALLYNMGQCQRRLGNGEEALHFYRTYLRRVPKGPSAVEAEKRIRELEDAAARARPKT